MNKGVRYTNDPKGVTARTARMHASKESNIAQQFSPLHSHRLSKNPNVEKPRPRSKGVARGAGGAVYSDSE